MGAFKEILALLWSLTTWLLDFTTYSASTVLLLLACLAFWRIPSIHGSFREAPDPDYRLLCLANFIMALRDVLCFGLGCLGALVPSRTHAYLEGTRQALRAGQGGDQLCLFWAQLFCNSFCDLPCLVLWLPSLIIPTRLFGTLHCTWKHWDELQLPRSRGDFCSGSRLRLAWLSSPFKGLMEVCSLLLGLVAMCTCVRSAQTLRDARTAWRAEANWGDGDLFNWEFLAVLAGNGAAALLDCLLLPLIFLLAITGWRLPPALAALRKRVDWATRVTVLRQALRLLADLLLFLPALLVLLTCYRSESVRKALRPDPTLALRELLQPLLAVRRRGPRARPPGDPSEEWQGHILTDYHDSVLYATGLLLLDVLSLPLLLIIGILACYRLPLLRGSLGPGTRFHVAVLAQLLEAFVDLPCHLAGLLVLLSLYRADLVVVICLASGQTAAWRRREVSLQLLRVLRDASMLLLAVPVILTLYRLPAMLLGVKVKLSRPLQEDPEVDLEALQVIAPRPRGRVGFRLQGQKSPNLSGITSMQINVIGEDFWKAVAEAPRMGPMVAQLAQSMLPLGLRDGREVAYSAVAHGEQRVDLRVELQQQAKHRTVARVLASLPPETRLVLQLEARLKSGRRTVLSAAAFVVGSCAAAVEDEDGQYPEEALQQHGEEGRREILAGLDQGLRRDSWWPVVLLEFLRVSEDLLHLLIALLLLALPWRLASAVLLALESEASRSARHLRLLQVALVTCRRACDSVAALLEVALNRQAKAPAHAHAHADASAGPQRPARRTGGRRAQTQAQAGEDQHPVEAVVAVLCCLFCPFCPNYSSLSDAGEFSFQTETTSLERQISLLNRMTYPPSERFIALRQTWSDGAEWASLGGLVDSWLASHGEGFYWLFLLSEWHMCCREAASRISDEQYSQLMAKLRTSAALAAKRREALFEQLQGRCQALKMATGEQWQCRLRERRAVGSILRRSLLLGIADLLAGVMLLFLLVTFYRLPRLCKELHGIPWGAEELKQAIRVQVLELALDIMMVFQLVLLTAVLLVTVVKFPDFVCGLRFDRGLRPNRDWALVMLSELIVGVGEMLLLLTHWKTYKLMVKTVILAVFTPAAILAVAVEIPCSTTWRFSVASAVWLGLLALNINPGLQQQLTGAGVLALAFAGLSCGPTRNGWLKPRGGTDWWSPVVRATLPNLMALLAVSVEGATVALAALPHAPEPEPEPEPEHPRAALIGALAAVGLSLFLTALPVVAEDGDQLEIVRHDTWRCLFSLLHEVLFLPVVLALTSPAADSFHNSMALLYFLTLALLSSPAWDVPVPRSALLDIRSVGLCSNGGRLLLAVAVIFATHHQHALCLVFIGAHTLWQGTWLLLCGSSVTWVVVLHLGVGSGGFDVLGIFEQFGNPSNTNLYLFNGGFVDGGKYSVEVMLQLLAWKVAYPSHFRLGRGNHETDINEYFGFQGEVLSKYSRRFLAWEGRGSDKYGMEAYDAFQKLFTNLPLAHVVNGDVFVVHGGLPDPTTNVSLDDIRSIDRVADFEKNTVIRDLLWGDPQDELGYRESNFWGCVTSCFGPDVTQEFLRANGLKLLIRSHEAQDKGFLWQHDGKCLTVFSAPNCCRLRKGAVVRLTFQADGSLQEPVSVTTFAENSDPLPVHLPWGPPPR